jgi:hypothetical protein
MTNDDSTKIEERERLARQQQEEEDAMFARSSQQPGQQQDEEEDDDAKLARSLLAAETDDNEASPALPDRMMNQLLTQTMLAATCKNNPLLSQIRNVNMPFGN